MKVFMTGGTGFVGTHLSNRLVADGHEISILTRGKKPAANARERIKLVEGDPTQEGPWQEPVADQDVLINLAGLSIFGRWSDERKRLLRDSRIQTTRNLVDAIPEKSNVVLLSTSAVGYYGFHEDEVLDESSPPGDDFLARLAQDWEAEAMKAQEKGARVVLTRFGIVLGRGEGALEQMVAPFRKYIGGPIGSGLQWISWIHMADLVEAFVHILDRPDLSGPINLTAPYPARNKDFSKTLGKVLGKPSWAPAPGFMIKLVLGEFGSVILKGQRVLPKRLTESGFRFQYPELEGALRDLLS